MSRSERTLTPRRRFLQTAGAASAAGVTTGQLPEAGALSHVFGHCVGNDFSARDLQFETTSGCPARPATAGGPIGPWLVGADQIDPNRLDIECQVNGQTRQSSNTARRIFDCKQLVSFISARVTLSTRRPDLHRPPEGVIIGDPKDKQVWLRPGDVVTTRIEKRGTQEFRLV